MAHKSSADFPEQEVPSENSPEASSGNPPNTPTVSSENPSATPTESSGTPTETPTILPESPAKSPVASGPSVKRLLSARKIQANRSNSFSSTGPTSRAGKNRVRWNSYKHGLLAKALFSRPIDGEKPADFYRFLKDLRRDIEPVGIREEMHAQGAAVCFWLIQRSLKYVRVAKSREAS